MGWDEIRHFLAKANIWTGQQTFSSIAITGGSISGVTFAEKNVTKSGSAVLTADECTGAVITIYGQTGDMILTLPTAFAGGSFRVQVSADLAKYIRITPNGSEIQSFDGIDLNASYYVYLSAATKGAMIQYVAIKTGASSWQWCALTITGQWYAQA